MSDEIGGENVEDWEKTLAEAEKNNRRAEKTNKAVAVLLVILVIVNLMAYLDKIIVFAHYVLSYLN